MSQAGPLPYLEFCGVEIANAARTVEYLRNGLGDTSSGRWMLGDGDVCGVLYRTAGGTCAAPEAFVSPAADPAPWYDPLEPGSESFLGLVLLDLRGYDSTIARTVTPRVNDLGGGVVGMQRRLPRTWNFRGAMVSADDAGAEYGLRWLTSVLESSACDGCETCALRVRLVCPPGDCSDDALGEWTAYDSVLTAGPKEVEPRAPGSPEDALVGCRDVVVVEFEVISANPYLYRRPEVCLEATVAGGEECTSICDWLFGAPGDAVCCEVAPPARGTLGAIFTLSAGSGGMGSLLIEAYADCPGGSGEGDAALRIELSEVPAGATVVVDSARHLITVTDAAGTANGEYLVTLAAGRSIEWIEVRDCDDPTCVCVRAAAPCVQGSASVTIATQAREG